MLIRNSLMASLLVMSINLHGFGSSDLKEMKGLFSRYKHCVEDRVSDQMLEEHNNEQNIRAIWTTGNIVILNAACHLMSNLIIKCLDHKTQE